MSGHGYRYVGKGDRFDGVPPRNLTQTQYDALSPLAQRTVDTSGAYEPIKVETKTDKKPESGAKQGGE